MAYVSSVSRPTNLGDQFLVLLSVVLLGYAVLGKGFAYLGFPPLFIGEIAFFVGSIALLRSGCLFAALASMPSFLLAMTMVWVLLRTLPFVGFYGFDALRDSVVIMYGGFSFMIVALLLEDECRLNTIIRYYRAFLNVYIPIIPFVFAFSRLMSDHIPRWPKYDVAVLLLQPGEVAAHLVGATVFALVGFRRVTLLGIIPVLVTLPMISIVSRGAMLAAVVPIVFAALLLGKVRELATVVVIGLAAFVIAYSVETSVTDYREARSTHERSLSTRQIAENAGSIVGYGGQQTEGTKTWRIDWWNIIISDTVFGPHFWTGRGFGLNLADADGFLDRTHREHPPLRSPHCVHMTMLARAGVPGLVLWAALLASWFGMVLCAMWAARRRGETQWAGLFLFIACYAMSCIINATFDVAIEGPMQGIWFWCLVGLGTGSVMIYRCQRPMVSEMTDRR
jgi:hypothetical protein